MARKYDHEYKVQAVKLAKEIGGAKAAKELGIPEGTIHTWLKAVRAGKLDIGEGSHTPASAMSLSEEITMLRKRVKEQDKEIRRLKEENGILQFNAVVVSNTPARNLYQQLGFVQLGVIPGGFRMKDGHFEDIVLYYHLL